MARSKQTSDKHFWTKRRTPTKVISMALKARFNKQACMKMRFLLACVALLFTGHILAGNVEKGVPETPPNAKAIAGDYYCGDGTGYNVFLSLKENGSYAGVWRGCLGKYGEASGKWKISDKRVVLTPKNEKGMMKSHLRQLDALKYNGGWIFVRSNEREFYDKYGVSRYSCFQRMEKK
jgi:hypothetical protein